MSDPIFQDEVQLTIRDRINYPYILANQILTIQRVLLNEEAPRVVIDSVEALVHQIPDLYKDDAFAEELGKATVMVTRDIRPKFGGITLDEETCLELGMSITKEVEIKNPWLMLQAVINLLQRRSMLTRRSFVEKKIYPEIEYDE